MSVLAEPARRESRTAPTRATGQSAAVQRESRRPTDTVPEENQRDRERRGQPLDGAASDDREREAVVTARWQSMLGEWLGGEMAALVLEHVSLDALNGYVKEALAAGGAAIGDVLRDETKPADAKQIEGVKKFSEALAALLVPQVERWMASPGAQRMLAKIANWVQDHPRAVMLIAGSAVLGGAVAAWCANPDLDISVPMGLGAGWQLKAGIDLGKLKNMTYQGASLAVSSKATKIELRHTQGDNDEGEATSTLALNASTEQRLGGTLFRGASNVSIADDVVTVRLDGGLTTTIAGQRVELAASGVTDGPVKGRIKLGEGTSYREITGERRGDVVTFSTRAVFAGGSVTQTMTSDEEANTQGQQTTASVGLGRNQTGTMTTGSEGTRVGYNNTNVAGSHVGVSASAGTNATGQTELRAGVRYDDGVLKTQLDYLMRQGRSSLNLAASANTANGLRLSTALRLDETRMAELALKMGYQDPTQFRGFLLGYKRQWVTDGDNGAYVDHFDALLEYSIGRWYARLAGGLDLTGQRVTRTTADMSAGYQLTRQWTLVGGMQMNGARDTETNQLNTGYRPYVGAQYNGVGVAAYYDTQSRGGGLMLTIPLGRR